MRGLLRLIVLKAICMAIVVPLVFVVSGLLAFLLARGISRLAGRDMDELGAFFLIPIAVSLLLLALFGLAQALRKFDERKAARGGLMVQQPRERAEGGRTPSSGPERLP